MAVTANLQVLGMRISVYKLLAMLWGTLRQVLGCIMLALAAQCGLR